MTFILGYTKIQPLRLRTSKNRNPTAPTVGNPKKKGGDAND
nr:MAG TPA: hypothetical protein [Siphoviridae sp. ctmtD6]